MTLFIMRLLCINGFNDPTHGILFSLSGTNWPKAAGESTFLIIFEKRGPHTIKIGN